jgi:hypothetical protein
MEQDNTKKIRKKPKLKKKVGARHQPIAEESKSKKRNQKTREEVPEEIEELKIPQDRSESSGSDNSDNDPEVDLVRKLNIVKLNSENIR